MSFVPAPHPPQFRRRAIDLARSGIKPIAALAKELSISESCLRNSLSQAEADEGRANSSRLSSDEKRELAELRRKARRLEWRTRSSNVPPRISPGGTSSKVVFPLVRELANDGFSVAVTCRVLGVRRQGFYEWCSGVNSPRVEENELLLKHIERIHVESRGTYGWPRVHAELALGMVVNHKRVARLMREVGIQGLHRRRRRGCTVRDLWAEPYIDLVDRDFVGDGPDEIWCTDISASFGLVEIVVGLTRAWPRPARRHRRARRDVVVECPSPAPSRAAPHHDHPSISADGIAIRSVHLPLCGIVYEPPPRPYEVAGAPR